MLTKIRENIYIADAKVTIDELKKAGITIVLSVDQTIPKAITSGDDSMRGFIVELTTDKINKPHIKDVACHIPKYMTQNGETIVVMDQTGLKQATYVVARAICEMEGKSIYEVFTELEPLLPGFEINGAYL